MLLYILQRKISIRTIVSSLMVLFNIFPFDFYRKMLLLLLHTASFIFVHLLMSSVLLFVAASFLESPFSHMYIHATGVFFVHPSLMVPLYTTKFQK